MSKSDECKYEKIRKCGQKQVQGHWALDASMVQMIVSNIGNDCNHNCYHPQDIRNKDNRDFPFRTLASFQF